MTVHASSFRDPSGYMYVEDRVLKRAILPLYFKQYRALTDTGFYKKLMDKGLLIPHKETLNRSDKISITPVEIPFFTYPYEWSFLQYKHAALLTLKLQKISLQHGFSLKDASAFNISFYKGRPIFIDTLSFDFYEEGAPWRAYKQFVMHFLGPLVLAKYHGAAFLKNMSTYIEGIPIAQMASLLPFKTRFHLFLYTNIHLLAKYESKYKTKTAKASKIKKISKKAQLKIIDHVYDYIKRLKLFDTTEWGAYYEENNYNAAALEEKAKLVKEWATDVKAHKIIDIGGNNGAFARKMPQENTLILVADTDTTAVNINYEHVVRNGETHILPMVCDLLNPSPAVGFNNTERFSFLKRIKDFKPQLCLALALIHHISLSGNIPFLRSAAFFAAFCEYLLIEFPEEADSQVQFLLDRKGSFKSHFSYYTKAAFEEAYGAFFSVVQQKRIAHTHRTLYLLKNKSALY